MQKYQRLISLTGFGLLINILIIFPAAAHNNPFPSYNTNKKLRILAIDGGGVRGIIPARILQEIEEQTGKPIFKLFDLVIGNSTGGLIALGLMAPDGKGNAQYKASDLVEFYRHQSRPIFRNTLFRKLRTGWGLWAPKFSRKPLDKILKAVLGETTLSQTLKNVLVMSYSLDTGEPHLWSSHQAYHGLHPDYKLHDIAGATTAAPTYFAPKALKTKDGAILYEADGVLWANNLEITALLGINSTGVSCINNDRVLLVSIGTGLYKPSKSMYSKEAYKLKDAGIIGWLLKAQPNLLDMIGGVESDWAQSLINSLAPTNYSLQVPIPKRLSNIDNSKHVPKLKRIAEDYIKKSNQLKEVCKILAELATE